MSMTTKVGLSLGVALLVAVAIGGCAPAVEAKSARFSILRQDGPVTWAASEADVRRFNEAYANATRLSDDNGIY
jgi:ABC-type glycerol-3-phosphate transport system substrate-binding protein